MVHPSAGQCVPRALSSGIKLPGHDADHSSTAEIKNSLSYTSTSPICLHAVVLNSARGQRYLYCAPYGTRWGGDYTEHRRVNNTKMIMRGENGESKLRRTRGRAEQMYPSVRHNADDMCLKVYSAHSVYLCVPYGSHNKQRLFP
jgi:hypothetical protein